MAPPPTTKKNLKEREEREKGGFCIYMHRYTVIAIAIHLAIWTKKNLYLPGYIKLVSVFYIFLSHTFAMYPIHMNFTGKSLKQCLIGMERRPGISMGFPKSTRRLLNDYPH